MSDAPTLVRFHMGWAEDGVGKDGLPLYREQLKITKERPPWLRITNDATEADIDEFREPYALFEREQAAIKVTHEAGYPLVMWPACSPSHFKMLAARDIVTVEQLAKLAGRGGNPNTPAEIKELAERAAKLIAMQKDVGKFEAIITDKDGQIEALREQVDEAIKTINAQKAIIDRMKVAG